MECALILHRFLEETPPFEQPQASTKEARILRFTLRHLKVAAAFGARVLQIPFPLDLADQSFQMTGPLEFDLRFVELFVCEEDDLCAVGVSLLQAVHEWRLSIAEPRRRAGVRRHLSIFGAPILRQLKCAFRIGRSSETASLLSRAAEVLGPARHLYDYLSFARDSGSLAPVITPLRSLRDSANLGSKTTVIHCIDDDKDLLLICYDAIPEESGYGPAKLHRIRNGSHNLAVASTLSFGFGHKPGPMHPEAQRGKLQELMRRKPTPKDSARREILDKSVKQFAARVSCVLSDSLSAMGLEDRDLLIIATSSQIQRLPWAILECGGKPLIAVVGSLTLCSSMDAAHHLGTLAHRPVPFEITAYFQDTDSEGKCRLDWERLANGLEKLPGATLCRHGPPLKRAALREFPREHPNSNVFVLGGHGRMSPRQGETADAWGIWLADGWWNPVQQFSEWQHHNVECCILPSCRLGEVWLQTQGSGEEPDPNRHDVVGFVTSMCAAGIPRVLACPWVVYDKPICTLTPMIVEKAIEKREQQEPEPHYWARAHARGDRGWFGNVERGRGGPKQFARIWIL